MGAAMGMFMYAQALGEDRAINPREDMTSAMMTAEVDGERLTAQEFGSFFILLAVAGNETTRNAISGGLLAFFEHPDQWQRLGEHPELIDTAVEEILRYTSPVNYFRRTATVDCDLGGHHIRAGEKVTLWYPSGNRDEAVFDDPHRFDIARTPNHHMAFGAGGPHYCLGASLAKLELKVMFEGLVQRLPDLALAGPPERLRNNLLNSIKHLPITFTPVDRVLSD